MRSLASLMMAILAAFALQLAVAGSADARQGGHGGGGGIVGGGGGGGFGGSHGGAKMGNFGGGPRMGNFSRGPRFGNFSRAPRFGKSYGGPRITKFYGGGQRYYKHSGRHFRRFRHRRSYVPYLAAYPYYYYGSYYSDSCYWLKRKAIRTGSRYWWRRYQECRYDYDY